MPPALSGDVGVKNGVFTPGEVKEKPQETFSLINLYIADLKFVDQHNMVACLEKTEENAEFHQIVDFLSTCSISYALTARNHIGGADAQTGVETVSKRSSDPHLLTGHTVGSGEDRMEQETALTDFVPPTPHDSPLSGGHTLISGSTADQVSTARPEVSAATPSTPRTTTTIFGDEGLTIAQNLIKMRSKKAKEKGVAFRDVEEPPRLTRLTTTLQHLPTIDPKDKGKGVLVEEEPEKLQKVKRRDQGLAKIKSDVDLAQRIYEEELAELDRAQKERQKQEEATIAALTEGARLLAEYFERIKKQLAAKRAEAIRNKPPTRTQVMNRMITYLKHMCKYTHQQLKHKTLEKLQMLYEREKKWIDDFVPMDFEKEEKKSVKHERNVDMEDEHVYKIIRENRNTSYHKSISIMLKKFDRQDLVDLHRLVMKRFKDNTPEGYNLLLWGDLKVMFEPNAEDAIWSNQQDWNLISWKLYENYGIHTLLLDGTLNCFNMLVEKMYPLIKKMLKKMLNWKLKAEAENTMEFKLLKFIKS
nr:hypothetical protein [Tanacetum cinerariifolium]